MRSHRPDSGVEILPCFLFLSPFYPPPSAPVRSLRYSPFLQAFLLLVVDSPLIHHFGFAHYCAVLLSCSYFAIGQSQYHMTSSVCMYFSLVCESLFFTFVILGFPAPSLSLVARQTSGWKIFFSFSLYLSLNIIHSSQSTPNTKLLKVNSQGFLLEVHKDHPSFVP